MTVVQHGQEATVPQRSEIAEWLSEEHEDASTHIALKLSTEYPDLTDKETQAILSDLDSYSYETRSN